MSQTVVHQIRARQAQNRASSTTTGGSSSSNGVPWLGTLNAARRMTGIVNAVNNINEVHRRPNTVLAYEPRANEWVDFCNELFNGDMLVTAEKTHAFMFYHSFRAQRPRGGKRSQDGERLKSTFDLNEYKELVEKYGSTGPEDVPDDPDNPCGPDSFNTYKSVVWNVYRQQRARYSNTLSWKDDIWNVNNRALFKMVTDRHKRVHRNKFTEKIGHEMSPLTSHHQLEECEEWFWNEAGKNGRSALNSIRNRQGFLNCYKGLVRSESLFIGKLSDCFGIEVERPKNEDDIFTDVMGIETGKTTSAKHRQFSRCTRSRNVRTCPAGGKAFYFFYRFKKSGEFDDGVRPDFTKNEEWFRIKMMSDGKMDIVEVKAGPDKGKKLPKNCVPLDNKTFFNQIAKMFKELGIQATHVSHWGRVAGPCFLELQELGPDFIEQLGNWDPNTQQKFYSSNIPLRAMRVMAGYKESELHLNPRYVVMWNVWVGGMLCVSISNLSSSTLQNSGYPS